MAAGVQPQDHALVSPLFKKKGKASVDSLQCVGKYLEYVEISD